MDSYNRGVPVPPIPEVSPPTTAYKGSQSYNAHPRSESMTNRGRFSYASTANNMHASESPRRIRRRKDPTPFNVLVIGSKGCGKTSFINFLRTALATPIKRRPTTPSPDPHPVQVTGSGSFASHYLETELEGERIGLTLYDSKGLERHLVDLQLREMSSFLESKFQETFSEEQKVMRSAGVKDTHIHCVFLILDPSRLDANLAASMQDVSGHDKENHITSRPNLIGGLDESLDVGPIRALEGKTTVIPIIAKADAITTAHMAHLKRAVWDSMRQINFDPLQALDIDAEEGGVDDEDESDELEANDKSYSEDNSSEQSSRSNNKTAPIPDSGMKRTNGNRLAPPVLASPPQHGDVRFSAMSLNVDLPYLPMSIISPDEHDPGIKGRRFPWGFADCYNAEHCDFLRLKDTVFNEWRAELRTVSRERWYEGWRENRLNKKRGLAISTGANGQVTSTGTSRLSAPLSPAAGQRTVSSAAAYGSLGGRQTSGSTKQRAVSANEIGVAIGDTDQSSPSDTSSGTTAQNGYAV